MRALLVIAVVLIAFAAANAVPETRTTDPEWLAFRDFEMKFQKRYASVAERSMRFSIFKSNLRVVDELNLKNGKPAFGVTKFMDLSPEEFKETYLTADIDVNNLPYAPMINKENLPAPADIPASYSWYNVTPAVVTPIKNQEQCGSCWAFSATEQIESVWALASHPIVALAPQQIVDCDKTADGCNGGETYWAYEYVIHAGGMEPETDYPYTAKNGPCKFQSSDVVAKISAWNYVSQKPGDENTTMLPFVASTAPISVCVDAASWQYYTKGVLKTCGQSIDHCVQITGYLTADNTPAWIVRNSWGTDWGLDGFIWVERNVNICGIATVATTVTAAS